MSNLHYQFYSNDELKKDKEVNYLLQNNILNFKVDDDLFKLDLVKSILIKRDQEKEIKINLQDTVINITLLTNNIIVDYPIKECTFNHSKQNIKIEYVLESDELLKNTIIIDY